jgi:hypothetical protein
LRTDRDVSSGFRAQYTEAAEGDAKRNSCHKFCPYIIN